MKHRKVFSFLLLALLFVSGFSAATEVSSSSPITLSPYQLNLLLQGEQAIVKTGPLNKNVKSCRCEVKGSSLRFVERTGNPSSGYIFRYDAVQPGESLIIETVSKFGKGGDKVETRKFQVCVLDADSIPKITLKELKENIGCYKDQFVKLSGVNRGWGRPEKAHKVWGAMLTRSDWILEDDTGAVYVTGMPQAKRDEAFTFICKVVTPSDKDWALVYYRRLTAKDHPETVPIVKLTNAFAFDLYKKLVQEESNISNTFFSPLSISYALAMTYAGARGNTEKQMANVLHFTLPDEKLHLAFSQLLQTLTAKPKDAYKLRIANALWGQKDYHFLKEFKALIDRFYHGGFHEVDFMRRTEDARKKINRWIEQETEEKIKDLIARGDIDSLTRLVLTNAIYFKGDWASQFKKSDTRVMPFHVTTTTSVDVPMMYQDGRFPYFMDKDLQMLELPYSGDDLSMIVVLPDSNRVLKELENRLSVEKFASWLSRLREQEVKVYLPKFKLETKYYLAKVLAEMGMPDAFSLKADFSGMTGDRELYISKVIHQAYVNVDEEGTEATAATAVVMRLKSIRLMTIFKADHPFMFFIVHKATGSILFMGRVVNPSSP